MTRLVWDKVGDRRFETGLDRGVLYTTGGVGVPWNGLTAVKESPNGGELTSFYIDGVRYLTIVSREEFDGTIEALTYPDEFGIHDGTVSLASGLIALQQRRKPFALSYRTRIGDDLNGQERGYKIHLIYNVLAAPSERSYSSLGDRAEAMAFSWAFSAVPKKPNSVTKLAPLAHVIIDSTKTSAAVLRYLEEQIYGSDRQSSRLITLDALFHLFENPQFVYTILGNRTTGLNQLQVQVGGTGDLIGDAATGYYDDLPETRLVPTNRAGLQVLTPFIANAFVEDTTDAGTYTLTGNVLSEDSTDPGTYIMNNGGVHEDPTDEGTFLNGV